MSGNLPGDPRLRSPAQRLRHHAGVYRDHSGSTGRPRAASRCAKPANSSSVEPAHRPPAVSSTLQRGPELRPGLPGSGPAAQPRSCRYRSRVVRGTGGANRSEGARRQRGPGSPLAPILSGFDARPTPCRSRAAIRTCNTESTRRPSLRADSPRRPHPGPERIPPRHRWWI